MTDRPSLYVLGAGRVGLAVARLAVDRGVDLVGVWNRAPLSSPRCGLADGLPLEVAPVPPRRKADVWMLAVPDDAITPVAEALADARGPRPSVAAHCAGGRPTALLAPLRDVEIPCASWHPAMTFRGTASDSEALARAWIAIEGDPAAVVRLEALTDVLELRRIALDPAGKSRYHGALVLASNGRVALDGAAIGLLEDAGLDAKTARRLLAPLVERTDENLREAGPDVALTGPVARGDAETVRSQLAALADRPATREAYRALAALALSLVSAERRGSGHDRVADVLRSDSTTPVDKGRTR